MAELRESVRSLCKDYVDNLLITTPSVSTMERQKDEIKRTLEVKDLGEVHDYLGIEI
jgi:hypothetical protein